MPFPDLAGPLPASLPHRSATRRLRAIPPGAAALLLAALLGGCTRSDAFAPACPQLTMLKDGADFTRFAGAGRDMTDLVLDAHLTAVPASCHWADDTHRKVEAKLQVAMSLGRGPAMGGRSVDVPYFVAVTQGEHVLDRQSYAVRAEFPANADRVSVTGDEVTMLFPVEHDRLRRGLSDLGKLPA